MNEYMFKGTNLITESFEKHGVNFDVKTEPGREVVRAGFSIDCGPDVIVMFINQGNDNAVAVRVFHLVSRIPKKKCSHVSDTCNMLNEKVRFAKFYVSEDCSVDVAYDFLLSCSDECVGEMAFEIFVRLMHILNNEYGIFMKALYTNDELCRSHGISRRHTSLFELVQKIGKLRKLKKARNASFRTIVIEKTAENTRKEDIKDETSDS